MSLHKPEATEEMLLTGAMKPKLIERVAGKPDSPAERHLVPIRVEQAKAA